MTRPENGDVGMAKRRRPRLRVASKSDSDEIAQLVYEVLAEYGLEPDPAETDADLRDIEASYLLRGGVFRVLEEQDGAIVGAYGLYPIDGEVCELRKMYLPKAYRGRGFGKMLLEDALAKARELGFARVVLETASVLTEAIGLYESYGFARYQPEHMSRRCDVAYVLALR